MKRILITGANSYIGTSFEKWLAQWPDDYLVDTLDMREESWHSKDFSPYDVVFHVAGIAHVKETKKNKEMYYEVNRDLAFKTAKKAKYEGVKQFIFLSSMSVYGISRGNIDNDTLLSPKTHYGNSKLQAEELLNKLGDDLFKIAIVRPPMVYGKGSRGNYQKLSKIVLKVPIFPNIKNKRSMIYIYNLCQFIKLNLDYCQYGVFCPQNKEYVITSEMVKSICKNHNKRILLTRFFNPVINNLRFGLFDKIFGDLVYCKNLSQNVEEYCVFDFEHSIVETEN